MSVTPSGYMPPKEQASINIWKALILITSGRNLLRHGKKQVYTGDDYLQKMLADHKGNVVVLAGNNQKKTRYIMESIKAGYHVLADKPLAINPQDFKLLTEAYQLAKEKNLLLYDLMTERYDILNIIEKSFCIRRNYSEIYKKVHRTIHLS